MGRRGGFGRGNIYHATGLPGWVRSGYYGQPFAPAEPISAKEEVEYLKRESEYLKSSLEEINRRIEELNKKADGEK
jgi:hypothetical protein